MKSYHILFGSGRKEGVSFILIKKKSLWNENKVLAMKVAQEKPEKYHSVSAFEGSMFKVYYSEMKAQQRNPVSLGFRGPSNNDDDF